jgi:hypothetical protein
MLPVEANKGDQCTGGLNFVTLRPKREILADYRAVVKHVFAPETYFARVRRMGRALNPAEHAGKRTLVEAHREFRTICRLVWCMTFTRPALRKHFWKTALDCAVHNYASLVAVLTMIAYYLHLGDFSQFVLKDLDRQIEALDLETSPTPLPQVVSQAG